MCKVFLHLVIGERMVNEPCTLSSQQLLFVGCLTSQQHVSVSQGRICSDNFTLCRTETEVADQPFHHTQSQYTDTRPTSPSTDPITPGAWQGSHWSANFWVTGMTGPQEKSLRRKWDSNPGSSALEADALTTWPTRWSTQQTSQLVHSLKEQKCWAAWDFWTWTDLSFTALIEWKKRSGERKWGTFHFLRLRVICVQSDQI